MKEKENGKVVRYIAKKEYAANWKRNFLTIVAIVLTTFLITTVCSLGGSYWKTVTRRSVTMEGIRYDVSIPQPTKEQVSIACKLPEIKDAGLSVKCAVAREYKEKILEIRLFWADTENWEKQCIPAFEFVEGTYPKNENEIMLSTRSLKEMGIESPKIGMKITLEWESLSEKVSVNKKETEFELTGYYREYTGQMNGYVSEKFYKTTNVKQTDITKGMLYLTLQHSLYSETDIEELGKKLKISERQMIYADPELLNDFLVAISTMSGLLILIFLSGYLFIYNVLYISITKDIKHYGQLKAIGMIDKQLKKYVWWQIFWNLLWGVPFGLLLGVVVATRTVPILLKGFTTVSAQHQILIFHPIILIVAFLFSVVTVCIGSYKPVHMLSKMSPIEALGYFVAQNSRHKKDTKIMKQPSLMVWKNVFRDRKQAIVVLLSFFLSMTTFLCISTIMEGKSAKTMLNQSIPYDMRILSSETMSDINTQLISEELLKLLKKEEGIKEIKIVYSQNIAFAYGTQILDNYYKQIFNSALFSEERYHIEMEEWKKNENYNMMFGRLVGIDENGLALLNKKMENCIDKDSFLQGDMAVLFPLLREASAKEVVGNKLKFRIYGKEQNSEHEIKIEVQNIKDAAPNYYGIGYGPTIVICNSLFEDWVKKPIVELVDIDYDTSFNADMDKKIRSIISNNLGLITTAKMDAYMELYQTEMQMRILGNSLCLILAILSILNFANLMTISIQNRKHEFAILACVGMTRKQMENMVTIEGILYAGMAIGLTIVIGIPVSYMIYTGINNSYKGFQIPVLKNIGMLICMTLCCAIIPKILYKVLQKGSITDQLIKN